MNAIDHFGNDDHISDSTESRPQELPLAGKARRVANSLIDYVFCALAAMVGTFVVLVFTGAEPEGPAGQCAIYASIFLYYFVLEVIWGRTIGKVLTRTKVVRLDGSHPSAGQIFVRTLTRFIPAEYWTFLFTDAGLHDRIGKTRVIQTFK